jgi:hypothetical protein
VTFIRCSDGKNISVECLIDVEPRWAFVELAIGRTVVALSPSDARALAKALVEQAEGADEERAAAQAKRG